MHDEDDTGHKRAVSEHGQLEAILGRIVGCSDGELTEIADDLRAFMRSHFEHEEQAGGFLDFLYRYADKHRDLVGQLRREHRELLDVIESACTSLTAEQDPVKGRRSLDDLKRRLEDHESIERRVLKAALVGAGGSPVATR